MVEFYLINEEGISDVIYKLVDKEMWDWINKGERIEPVEKIKKKGLFKEVKVMERPSKVKIKLPENISKRLEEEFPEDKRLFKHEWEEGYLEIFTDDIYNSKAIGCPSARYNGRDMSFDNAKELAEFIRDNNIKIIDEFFAEVY